MNYNKQLGLDYLIKHDDFHYVISHMEFDSQVIDTLHHKIWSSLKYQGLLEKTFLESYFELLNKCSWGTEGTSKEYDFCSIETDEEFLTDLKSTYKVKFLQQYDWYLQIVFETD